MTPAQLQALKTWIQTSVDPTIIAAGSDDVELARLLNQPSQTIIWRSRVGQDEIMQNGFDWVRVDNLSVGKARIWDWLFANPSRSINPTKPNVRAGIAECWKGTAADLAVQAAVFVHCKRTATRVESVFATGLGTEVSPSVTSFEGVIIAQDISDALRA